MTKKINSRIFGFSLLSALLLSFFIYPSGNVSAAQESIIQSSNTSEGNISPLAIREIYVTKYTTTSSFPPGQKYFTHRDGDFLYSGTLTLFEYVHDPDAGLYFATYKGWLKIQ
ncbi:hypothetical protein [Lysinibacillus parviboronicapiens]|uniref:hypothetical protein n=1 Tax=Lysinibacillus parviboronicapiens TaxID=436516 RepID=UPI000D3C4759|nr:hypothetical protein [Lysinibacillus parviboronicapiens]